VTRDRTQLVQERSREVNRVQGVLKRVHITLASVATDMMGVSGRTMLAALVEGRATLAVLADLAKGRLRSKIPRLAQALTGLVRDHHRRMLAIQWAHIDFLDEQIDVLSAEESPPAPSAASAAVDGVAEPAVPGTPLTCTRAIALLDTIPGVARRGAARWVAETGIGLGRGGPWER
jgi:transposase